MRAYSSFESDPYTVRAAGVRAAPATWSARWRHLGPSVVIAGSIVGSGELILTSSLGAAAGFTLLWWLLLSCWSKSVVQAEFARYVLVSGDTYIRALNRIPGRLPWRRAPVSWTVWVGLLSFIPGVIGMAGILGGAGLALTLLVPALDPRLSTTLVAALTSTILFTGSYHHLERTMLALVAAFVVTTVAAAVAMQLTEFRMSIGDLRLGFAFDFPVEHLVLALAVYGATGVNAAEISTYTYWCIEKGYPSFIGAPGDDPQRPARARAWIKVVHLDVWTTLLILSCATLPFYLLGAGVLHPAGRQPHGLETVSVLSGMFTQTLGGWSHWIFAGAAFCILFSSAVAGFGGTARFLPDFLIEFALLERRRLATRTAWIRTYGAIVPLASLLCYLSFESPIMLLSVGALMGSLLLPIQSGATLWLHKHHMDPELGPSGWVRGVLWLTFMFQAAMAALVIWFVIL